MKVLLTGATGFLGGEIARELVAAGHEVRALVRQSSRLDNVASLPLERVDGDILDRASVDRAVAGVDAVIHTAACVGHRPRDTERVRRVNVEGTRNVLDAALAARVKRVVYTSSISAVGHRAESAVLDETAPWPGADGFPAYVGSKHDAEEVARAYAAKGLPVVILNPGYILGPGDISINSMKILLEYFRGPGRYYIEGGVAVCDVREVARAHVAALERGRPGERYILGGHNLAMGELLGTLARLSGAPAPVRLPAPLVYLVGAISELVALVRPHRLEELSRPMVRLARTFAFYDVSKAKAELGYEVRPIEETLRDSVRWLVERGLVEATTPELRAIAGGREEAPAAAVA